MSSSSVLLGVSRSLLCKGSCQQPQGCSSKGRILYDASQQPVVMATVPDFKGLFGHCGRPLLVLPQRVKFWSESESESESERESTKKEHKV